MGTIRNAKAPLLSYRDFMKSLPDVGYNELRSNIKELLASRQIETSISGYRIVHTEIHTHGVIKPKAKADATIKERAAMPKKVGVPCLCGCGETTKPGSFFMTEHDARTKGYVIKVNKGEIDAIVLKVGLDYGAIVKRGETYRLLTVAEIRKIKKQQSG